MDHRKLRVKGITEDDYWKVMSGEASAYGYIFYDGNDLSKEEGREYIKNLSENEARDFVYMQSSYYRGLSKVVYCAVGKHPDLEIWKDLVVLLNEELTEHSLD